MVRWAGPIGLAQTRSDLVGLVEHGQGPTRPLSLAHLSHTHTHDPPPLYLSRDHQAPAASPPASGRSRSSPAPAREFLLRLEVIYHSTSTI
jgi:hypothetical protein